MLKKFDFAFVECYAGTNNEAIKCYPKKIKIMKNVNNDELVLNSSKVVLEVMRGRFFFIKL